MAKTPELLVVDDDRMSMMLLYHQLRDLGFEVTALNSGQDALDLMDQAPERFDVVLLDRMMPQPDGMAITKEMARRPTLRNTPVIMVTGADSPDEIREGIDAGVHYYLTKPVKKELVQSLVGTAIRQRTSLLSTPGGAGGPDAFGLIQDAKFTFGSIEEAEILAGFVANVFPDPERSVSGIAALMFNAIEHGICEIGFENKGHYLRDGTLEEEIASRLSQVKSAKATAVVAAKQEGIYLSVSDPGRGFNWREFTSLDTSRTSSIHGRGIFQAKAKAFDKLSYQGSGNTVVGFVSAEGQLDW